MCYRYSVPGPDSLVKRFFALFLEPVPFKRQYRIHWLCLESIDRLLITFCCTYCVPGGSIDF